jgi:peptidase M48-like protein
MSFLNWPVEQNLLSRRACLRRKAVALKLLEQFGQAFPEIVYELLWESSTVNAQAWRFSSIGRVRVYGGLVRHPRMTRAGLALMLAHETGHHLAGPPYDPDMPWISWQGQADYWAASEGMKTVFGLKAKKMIMQGAAQIRDLHWDFVGGPEDQPDLSPECRHNIFIAGAAGLEMPECAKRAFTELCSDRP